MTKNSLPAIKIPSAKADDQPATRKLVRLVRNELKSDFRALDRKWDATDRRIDALTSNVFLLSSKVDTLSSKVDTLSSKVDALSSKVDTLSSKLDSVSSRVDLLASRMEVGFAELKAESFRMNALDEERNSNNRIALEGIQALWQRQARIESQHG